MEIVDLSVAESMKWTYLMFMQIWSMQYNQLHGYFVDRKNSYIYAMDGWFEGLQVVPCDIL